MDRLWSPWRLPYVTGAGTGAECIFCEPARSSAGESELVLVRGRVSYVILNLYPYNNGHLMIVPDRHIASLGLASPDELIEIMRLTRDAETALVEAYRPDGINLGINLGRSAGAGVIDHLHIHAVPRWTGDTSFMSVVGHTRVLPETLGDSAARLRPIFERLLRQHH